MSIVHIIIKYYNIHKRNKIFNNLKNKKLRVVEKILRNFQKSKLFECFQLKKNWHFPAKLSKLLFRFYKSTCVFLKCCHEIEF